MADKKIINNPNEYLKRELIGRPKDKISFKERLKKSKAIDLRENFIIKLVDDYYFEIKPINKNKIFK